MKKNPERSQRKIKDKKTVSLLLIVHFNITLLQGATFAHSEKKNKDAIIQVVKQNIRK